MTLSDTQKQARLGNRKPAERSSPTDHTDEGILQTTVTGILAPSIELGTWLQPEVQSFPTSFSCSFLMTPECGAP